MRYPFTKGFALRSVIIVIVLDSSDKAEWLFTRVRNMAAEKFYRSENAFKLYRIYTEIDITMWYFNGCSILFIKSRASEFILFDARFCRSFVVSIWQPRHALTCAFGIHCCL